MVRPSKIKGFGVNLLDFGLSGVHLLLALYLGLWGMKLAFAKDKHSDSQSSSTANSNTYHVQDLRSDGDKVATAAGEGINSSLKAADTVVNKLMERPAIAIPETPFAYLVEHLLNRGDKCPAPYNDFEECLKQCRPADLNRPLGLIHWELEAGPIWTMKTEEEFDNVSSREDIGPTYKVLYISGSNPPSNALTHEETVLTLASAERVAALVKAGADPELHYGQEGNTALIEAAQRCDPKKVKALLSAGANKSTRSAGNGQEPVNLIDVTKPGAEETERLLR